MNTLQHMLHLIKSQDFYYYACYHTTRFCFLMGGTEQGGKEKMKRKIVGILIVMLLIVTCFCGYVPEIYAEEIDTVDKITFPDFPSAITVSDSNPFYTLIATPLAVRYDDYGVQEVVPLYVKDFNSPSRAIERAEQQIGKYSDYIINDIFTPKEISLSTAKIFWNNSKGVLLIEDSQQGYNLGMAATPIASYLDIPIIVTDKIDDEVISVLEKLKVNYSYVCGDIGGYGEATHFDKVEDIVNESINIVQEIFGDVKYITLANPLDVTEAKILDTETCHFEGNLSSTAFTPAHMANMIFGSLKGAPIITSHEFEVPDEYKYVRIKIVSRNLVDENPDQTGASLNPMLFDPNGNLIAYLFTVGGVPIRNSNGEIEEDRSYWETIVYNQPGTYKIQVSGRYLTSKTGEYKIDVTVENLESAVVPSMKGLSSIAPYLTAYHKGILFAKPEFAFVGDENIVSNPSTGIVYPASNPGLITDANNHTYEIHESINELLARLAGIELTKVEDLKELRTYFDINPLYIALIGDATMIPHYYYYDLPDAVTLFFGWDVAGDFIYGNIDPIPRDDNISTYAGDLFTYYPYQENLVGRITGWDVQDASALIVRTIFYDEILNQVIYEEWKDKATVQSGSGCEAQRIPGIDLIQRIIAGFGWPIKWPTGASHFHNMMVCNSIENGGFDIISTKNLESMRIGFSQETLDEISKLGFLNKILFPKIRVDYLASDKKISGGKNQENCNFISSFGHGQPMGYGHGDIQMNSLGFRPVILDNLYNRLFFPILPQFSSGLANLGMYCVRFVENMNFGPSVIMVESCYVGRIDGLYPKCCISQAYIHAGVNTFISTSRGSPGPGYLDARRKPVGFGIKEYLETIINPELQKPHFGGLHAVNFFEDLTLYNVDVGTAFRTAKNKFLPMDANSTFFWTPPLSLNIHTGQYVDFLPNNFRKTIDEEDERALLDLSPFLHFGVFWCI